MSKAIQPVAWWIPEAEQFCMNTPEGRPFAKHWEPLYATPLASHAGAEPQCIVRMADGAREPEFVSWNAFPVGTHMLYATPPAAIPAAPSTIQLLAITTAYEQGVGKGHQAHRGGVEIANPYTPEWGCKEVWALGYDEGKEQAARELAAALTHPTTVQQAWAIEDDPYYNLLGVIADAKFGNFNAVCIETLERIAVQLKTAPTDAPGDAG